MSDEAAARARALALLKRHGWNATSFQILEPGFRYWFAPDDACVGYVDTGAAWIAAGAPVADDAALARAAEGFVAAARAAGRRAAFFATEDRIARDPAQDELVALRIGEQPVWDPAAWDDAVKATRSLREQLRRARAKGVVVRALPAAELAVTAREVFGADRVSIAPDLADAIDQATTLAEAGEALGTSIGSGAVLVTGSVVTVGEARAMLRRRERPAGG